MRTPPFKLRYVSLALLLGNVITAHAAPAAAQAVNESETTVLETVNVNDSAKTKTKVNQDSNNPRVKSYKHTNSRTATKTDTPLMETPASVQIVTKDVMQDQQVSDVKGALENVSGVRPMGTLGGGVGTIIRGFLTKNVYRNGLLVQLGNIDSLDAGNLESIEVLKGTPNLYGRSDVGGLVSLSTKRAIDILYYSVEQRIGSYNLYRTQWDAGGALTNDKSLAYRFSGAFQTNDSFRDGTTASNMVFAPSITWRPTKDTDITLDLEGVKKNATPDFGLPVVTNTTTGAGTIAPLSASRNLGTTTTPWGTPSGSAESFKLGTEINHKFNENWAIHNRFLAAFAHDNSLFWSPYRAAAATATIPITYINPANGNMALGLYNQSNRQETYTTNLDLTGKFEVAGTKHDVLVGFDYYLNNRNYFIGGAATGIASINVNTGGFTAPTAAGINSLYTTKVLGSATSPLGNGDYGSYMNTWYGIYFQDQITLFDKLHITGGGRYDWAEAGIGYSATGFGQSTSNANNYVTKDSHFSPRVGILYQPIHEVSLYGNWTTSFGLNTNPVNTANTFKPVAPQLGEQFEAGIKTQLFNDRLLASLAYYHIDKDNVMVSNAALDPTGLQRFASKQRSQGIELDVSGQITDSLSLIGSYAFTDARVMKDMGSLANNVANTAGKRLPNVAEHSGSIWAKYNFDEVSPALKGFSVGLGAFAAGKRAGDGFNSFNLPGYVRMDASLAYKTEIKKTKITAQFNIRNLLDKQYYESTDNGSNLTQGLSVQPGAPITAMGSIKAEF